MKMLSEFKTFAMKGNVIDMAVGIIIGLAFAKIINSIVNDILMPPIGMIIGGVNFTELNIVLREAVGENPAVTINYGNFIQVVIEFLLVAFALFMVIKAMNSARRKQAQDPPAVPPAPTNQEILLTQIRDLLKK